MVFKVEAKTAIDEARSWVRIAEGRLTELAKESTEPDVLRQAALAMAAMRETIATIEAQLRGVDEEWLRLFQPRASRGTPNTLATDAIASPG